MASPQLSQSTLGLCDVHGGRMKIDSQLSEAAAFPGAPGASSALSG